MGRRREEEDEGRGNEIYEEGTEERRRNSTVLDREMRFVDLNGGDEVSKDWVVAWIDTGQVVKLAEHFLFHPLNLFVLSLIKLCFPTFHYRDYIHYIL